MTATWSRQPKETAAQSRHGHGHGTSDKRDDLTKKLTKIVVFLTCVYLLTYEVYFHVLYIVMVRIRCYVAIY